jgi:oxygen-independent coproporphyrinogen III oxidase
MIRRDGNVTGQPLFMNHSDGVWGLYIHIPFCRSKCPYCHFTSIINGESRFGPYFSAVENELSHYVAINKNNPPSTIYIGGGTPSLVPSQYIVSLLERVYGSETIEITVEANPESLNPQWLDELLSAGVNRISIGVQSFSDQDLVHLGRIHTAQRARESVFLARQAGFDNISLDFMYGLPGQNHQSITETIEDTLACAPAHISWYGLSIEEDTAFYTMRARKSIVLPDADETADQYALIVEHLESAGFRRYEISNFSLQGRECLHNRRYWDFTPYLGVGISAHSFDGAQRWWNISDVDNYIQLVQKNGCAVSDSETIDDRIHATEIVMLGLRTDNGLGDGEIHSITGDSYNKFHETIEQIKHAGLIVISDDERYRLSVKGAVLADEIISELLTVLP